LTAVVAEARSAAAIPVFAKVYGQPCSACHTIFPELNPAGEEFRLRGLHGMQPVIKPIEIADWLSFPGTLPVAASLAVGEDVTQVKAPQRHDSTVSHFNLNYAALLAGGEIGPHLAALFDFAPLFANTRTGDLNENRRMGLGFVQAHVAIDDWLMNLRGGLFELPLGTSPRVHRLSAQSYLLYSVTAFSLLGRRPPTTERSDSLVLSATQYGAELSGQERNRGWMWALGFTSGSNNRSDNNDSKDVFARVGQAWGLHRAGFFLYYSPDVVGSGAHDAAWRFGPDIQLYYRQITARGQFLAANDSNPTGTHRDLWYYGGFFEGEYRFLASLASLLRFEYVAMPTFDDSAAGGARLRRQVWQLTAGIQWLLQQNIKVILETTYGQNHEGVSDQTAKTWSATARIATAFWLPIPPAMEEWLGGLT
jgi:hypothetical protein